MLRRIDYDTIYVEYDGPIARLVLNRPEKLNAYNLQMAYDVRHACDEIEEDVESRVLIVKGAGRSFCVGADLSPGITRGDQFASGNYAFPRRVKNSDSSQYSRWEYVRYFCESWRRLWTLRKPTISQVHGHCLAGGIQIAMECDIVVASVECQIGQPELRAQGVATDIALWPYTIGLRRTKELLFTGYNVRGSTAAEWGMINHAVPADDLEAFVEALAGTIGHMRPELLHHYKWMTNRVADYMGMSQSVDLATDVNTMASATGAGNEFSELAKREGLRKALELRDAGFGGQMMPDWLIEGRAPG